MFSTPSCHNYAVPLELRTPKCGKQPDYSTFRDGVPTTWSWLQMVAQLDEDTMVFVVRGPGGDRSRGLVSCEICRCRTSHDHNTRAQQVRDGAEKPVMSHRWDFFFLRDDGSGIRLQPEGSSRRIQLHNVDRPRTPCRRPREGSARATGLEI